MLHHIANQYVMISCLADALVYALKSVVSAPVVQITVSDNPDLTYIGLQSEEDAMALVRYARDNRLDCREIDIETMKKRFFRPGTFKVAGDASLAPWLTIDGPAN